MVKNFTKITLITLLLSTLTPAIAGQKSIRTSQEKTLSDSSIDFKIEVTGERKFRVSFFKGNNEGVLILKVYDVIGNLIYEEAVTKEGIFTKEFDLSGRKGNVFIVEVGNEKYNKTKRVFL